MQAPAPLTASTASTAADTLDRLLLGRHSCRAFLPQPLPDALIDRLLASAQRTASWCNTQPWQLLLTRGAGTEAFRTAMRQAARERPAASDIAFPPGYEGEHLARRRASGRQLYQAVGIARHDAAQAQAQSLRNFDFFDAPHVLIVTTASSLGPYALVDCGGWVANFLLAAQAHGVAAVPQAALARHSDVIRAHFALPSGQLVVCGIAFGLADAAHPANCYRTARADLAQVVQRFDGAPAASGASAHQLVGSTP